MQRNGFRTGTKFILWALFVIQLLLIGIFWVLQQGIGGELQQQQNNNLLSNNIKNNGENSFTVNFIKSNKNKQSNHNSSSSNITKLDALAIITNNNSGNVKKSSNNISNNNKNKNVKIEVISISNFSMDFIIFPPSSAAEEQSGHGSLALVGGTGNNEQQQQRNSIENITCFRQGIAPDDLSPSIAGNRKSIITGKCHCQSEWHGKDCGQPEVIWRAFMTSKVPQIVSTARREPHKVVYMITGNFFSLELLEIQVMELRDSVDFFIVCNKNMKRLKMNFANAFHDRILIIECSNINNNNNNNSNKNNNNNQKSTLRNKNSNNNNNCTPKFAYKEFKTLLDKKSLNSDDIFIFSRDDEILNHRAIKYLKYYSFPGVMRFRLKYNVYGFYWQHPESTRLGSVASTIGQLEKTYKSDPERLLAVRKPNIIVGDLNHIGGWYCKFCYQPSEIIEHLQLLSSAAAAAAAAAADAVENSIFPRTVKNRQIDAHYIQNLIASGLYVDGKLGLNKLHRFSDKYYAPSYVERNGWKFDNILVNLFLSFNDDDDEYER